MPRATKSEVIGLRASAAQRASWEAAARADGRSLSSWIARQLDRASGSAPAVYDAVKVEPCR